MAMETSMPLAFSQLESNLHFPWIDLGNESCDVYDFVLWL